MIKFLNLVLVVMVVCAAAMMYQLEHATRKLERDIVQLQNKIGAEEEGFKLLTAEWSSLTRPERIEKIAVERLHLVPVAALQVITREELSRLVARVTEQKDEIGALLESSP